jgi:hypothetical protein
MPSSELAAISQLPHFKVAPATSQALAFLQSFQAETSLLVITQALLWERSHLSALEDRKI